MTYWRLWYGLDLMDEAFYVTLPYRLVEGARPFVDETSVTQQTTAVLLYPFVKAYDAAVGMTGMFMFVRHLQFLLSLAVGSAVYASLRRSFDAGPAAFAALTAVVFVPFAIHGLSYNSVGSSLFTAGCFLGLRSLTASSPRRSGRRLAGICHGVAAFAYPPLAGAVAVTLVARLALRRGRIRDELVQYGLPALAVPVLGMLALVLAAGASNVVHDYADSSRYLGQAGGISKLGTVFSQQWSAFSFWFVVFPALGLVGVLWRFARRLSVPVLALLPFAFLPRHPIFFASSLEYAAHYGWLALPLFPLVRRHAVAVRLLVAVWVPALVAGVTTAYSSANGGVNFGVGFFPAAIVATLFLVLAIREAGPRGGRGTFRALAGVPAVAALVLLAVFDTVPVYHDGGLTQLDARVASGPFAGILTSARKRAYLDRLQDDLAPLGPRCTIVFFDDFPAGYLLTRARADTNAAWIAHVAPGETRSYQDALLRYYRRHGFPDTIVLERWIPFADPGTGRRELYRTQAPLQAALRRRYHLTLWRHTYAVYARDGSSCRPAPQSQRA